MQNCNEFTFLALCNSYAYRKHTTFFTNKRCDDVIEATAENNRSCIVMSANEISQTIAVEIEVSPPISQTISQTIDSPTFTQKVSSPSIQETSQESITRENARGEKYYEVCINDIEVAQEKAFQLVESLRKIKSLYYRIKFRLLRLIEAIYEADELF